MAFDLDDDELKATRKIYGHNNKGVNEMGEEIQEYLENTYNEMFEIEKQSQTEEDYKFIINFKNYKIKFTYLKTYTFNYNMLYLKSQVNKLITRFNIEGVDVK